MFNEPGKDLFAEGGFFVGGERFVTRDGFLLCDRSCHFWKARVVASLAKGFFPFEEDILRQGERLILSAFNFSREVTSNLRR